MSYTIYALIDPRDQAVRYIGMTHNIYSRMRQHSRCEENNAAKNQWIAQLHDQQLIFVTYSIEQVESEDIALEREAYWIRFCLAEGMSLFNITHNATQGAGEDKQGKEDIPPFFLLNELHDLVFILWGGDAYHADDTSEKGLWAWGQFVDRNATVKNQIDWSSLSNRAHFLNKLFAFCRDKHLPFPLTRVDGDSQKNLANEHESADVSE